jgi:homoserine kinase
MISQTANVALLVDSLYRDDVAGVAAAMAGDVVVEPARAHLMPRMAEVREAAIRAGALSVVISGAGPTLCAVCDSMATAQTAAQAMKNVYDFNRIASQIQVSVVDQRGAYVKNQRTAAQKADLS